MQGIGMPVPWFAKIHANRYLPGCIVWENTGAHSEENGKQAWLRRKNHPDVYVCLIPSVTEP
jgi:hypothetical protein